MRWGSYTTPPGVLLGVLKDANGQHEPVLCMAYRLRYRPEDPEEVIDATQWLYLRRGEGGVRRETRREQIIAIYGDPAHAYSHARRANRGEPVTVEEILNGDE